MRNVAQLNPLDWLTDVLGRLRDKIEWLHENILSDALKKDRLTFNGQFSSARQPMRINALCNQSL